MLRKVSTLSIAGALIAGVLVSTPAYAAVSNGSTCTTVNKITKVSGFSYKCVTAVKSTITLDGSKTVIYLPATATTKNAKKYYLATDCISESASYLKSVKQMIVLEASTAKAIAELDAQIVSQTTASADVQTQIDQLIKENADLVIEIKEQTDLIPIAQKEAEALTLKIAGITKQIDDFTKILTDTKAQLVTLKADTKNLTVNALAITKLSTAISSLTNSITNIKTSNSSQKIQLQSINGSISKYNSAILQLKSTILKNTASIDKAKRISANVTSINTTKELTQTNLRQAKDALQQTMKSRNLLCSAGL